MRITMNGKRAEMAIHRFIDPEYWNNESGVPRGTKNEIKLLNEYLVLMRSKVYQAQKSLIEDGKPLTSIAIRNIVQGRTDRQQKLLDIFEYHNKMMEEKIPSEYSPSTLIRFKTTKNHIAEFIRYQYNTNDLFISQLNHEFVTNLEHYFKTVRRESCL
jgi:hypothetical protein